MTTIHTIAKQNLVVICLCAVLELSRCGGGPGSQARTPNSLTVAPAALSLPLGATAQFKATGTFSDGTTQDLTTSVTWTSSNTNVATINLSGLVTTVGSGSTSITAASASTHGSATLTVSSPISVSISPHFSSLTFTQVQQFQASVQGSSRMDVTWYVDGILGGSSAVGTISTSGLYTPPVRGGSRSVSATSQADLGKGDTAKVVVLDYPGTFTWHNDNARTGQNLDEVVLTPQNVNANQFGKLFSYPVDGQVYAQPLYVANVNIAGEGFQNVVYVATEHDSVYAFDADGKASGPLWHVSFIDPASGITNIASVNNLESTILPEIGITGTPVIDPASKTLYVVAVTVENGNYRGPGLTYHLHALDIATGTEKLGGPVLIQATVPGTGDGSDGQGSVVFSPYLHLQRPGLLLLNGVVYIAFGSHTDSRPYHGWLLGYDAHSLKQVVAYNTTPNAWGASIWQSGAAPAADGAGNIYVMTANGAFDADTGGPDFGQSFLKLTLQGSRLLPADYFAPFNLASLNDQDLDLGSGGPLLLPDQKSPHPHLLVGGGKDGTIYLVDRDKMGGFNPKDNSQVVQTISVYGVWGGLAYWESKVYVKGVCDYLKVFQIDQGVLSTFPVSTSSLSFCFAATPSISAQGSTNGIVWLLDNDAWLSGGPTILLAFDADDVSKQRYGSNQAGKRDVAGAAVKFTVPTVANGKVYVGTASELDVYGLLPQ